MSVAAVLPLVVDGISGALNLYRLIDAWHRDHPGVDLDHLPQDLYDDLAARVHAQLGASG